MYKIDSFSLETAAGVNLVNDGEESVEMSNYSQTDEWKGQERWR